MCNLSVFTYNVHDATSRLFILFFTILSTINQMDGLQNATSHQSHQSTITSHQKSSICYNIHGKASINLKCPDQHQIKTTLAFTALSQSNTCSYSTWDCILQEGSTQQCDTKSACAITALYEDNMERLLKCDDGDKRAAKGGVAGEYMFFQVEYYCVSGKWVGLCLKGLRF